METKYAYVARRLAEDIASGRHPVGSILPKEVELAEQFNVSRATIRSALDELQQTGMLSRKRNSGTRVEAAQGSAHERDYHQSLNSIEDLVQYADRTERHIQGISLVIADDVLAEKLGCRPGSRWLKVSMLRVHSAKPDQPPICWTDVYLDEAFSDLEQTLRGYSGLIGSLVETRYGRHIAQINQSITADGVPPALAGALHCEPESHALHIRRRYQDATGAALLITFSVHPAGRFVYEISLHSHNR